MIYDLYKVLPLVDDTGQVVVVWQGRDGHVVGRAFDSQDQPLGETTVLVDNPPLDGGVPPPIYPAAALDDAGRLFVAWETHDPNPDHLIMGRIFEVARSP